ncbi:hypothetical protein N0V92_011186 [Colletotrichum tropicale]|nr:hypothetical protein N0V92_011186 [Colletotrichum tropicale]
MPIKQHGRQYDLVVFGATGYTGNFVTEHITTHLPSNLKWAVAGRSESKLRGLIAELKKLNSDRVQPEIEICSLNDEDLERLVKKTYILITTVGPYAQYGELAFRACAENGTHYMDVTGETPWTGTMINKYEGAAQETGAMMFPQIGIESAPPDLVTWSLTKEVREKLSAKTAAVTVSIHQLESWGLMASLPSREKQFYGPNFSFHEYMRAKGYLRGIAIHWALGFFGLLLATMPPFRALAKRFVYEPGQGPDKELAKKDEIEYRGIAMPDKASKTGNPQAYCRAKYTGSMYYLTGMLLAQAASTLLEDDVDLPGGVFTAACLGQPYIDRLHDVGFKFETKILDQ